MTVEATQDVTPAEGGSVRRRWPWLVGAGIGLFLVLYGLTAWAVAGRVPAGVEVAGVEIGGSGRAEALRTLESDLVPGLMDPAEVTVGSAEDTIDPEAAGFSADLEATVDGLIGFSLNPVVLWSHAFGGADAEVVTTADDEALEVQVSELAERVRSQVQEGGVAFDTGAPVATDAEEGRELEVDEAVDVLLREWPSGEPIALPADITEPQVDDADVEEAMTSFAVPATSAPLQVVVAGTSTELPPAAFVPALSMEPSEDGLAPRVDGELLKGAVLAANPTLASEPKDAQIVLQGGAPVVVPSAAGVTIDAAALAEAALPALTAPERTATLETAVAEPELTTEEAQALGVKEVVSEFSSNLTADAGRSENLRIAAQTINGTLLQPGETFSLNRTLGERTRAKGYNAAGAIQGGRFVSDVGGGVSQMSTTLFNGMFFAGLKDVEHKAHSLYISRYPEGREATVNWNNVDLKFKNDSQHGVLIETWVGGGQVHTRFWSTKVWDITASKGERYNYRQPKTITDPSPTCTKQGPQAGFDVDVTRTFARNGKVEKTEKFTTKYSAQNAVVCAPPPGPATASAPPPGG